MSHHIYHTEGIVLGSSNTGEANRYLTIFTRELGVVRAAAQGIRHGKSKLRYALQDFSFAKVDLVRGRDIWRLTSSVAIETYGGLLSDETIGPILYNAGKLIVRLAPFEQTETSLFEHFHDFLKFLQGSLLSKEEIKSAELLFVLRALYHLGYISDLQANDDLVRSPFDKRLLEYAGTIRTKLLSEINQSLKETML